MVSEKEICSLPNTRTLENTASWTEQVRCYGGSKCDLSLFFLHTTLIQCVRNPGSMLMSKLLAESSEIVAANMNRVRIIIIIIIIRIITVFGYCF